MGNLTTYAQNKTLDFVFRNQAFTSPTTVYAGLFTADPTAAGTQTSEPSGNAYARQAVAFSAPSGASTSNTAQINFPIATGSWGTIAFIGILDAVSAGNMLWYGPTTSRAITTGQRYFINAAALIPSITGLATTLGNSLLSHMLRNTAYTPAATVYATLHTADPNPAGGNEQTSYTRQALAFGASSGGSITTTADINFTSLPAGTDTHAGVYDALTVGNFLEGAALSASVTNAAGDTVQIVAGTFTISIT